MGICQILANKRRTLAYFPKTVYYKTVQKIFLITLLTVLISVGVLGFPDLTYAQVVSGECAPTHYNCITGDPSNQSEDSGWYHWYCGGSPTITAVVCSEAKSGGGGGGGTTCTPSCSSDYFCVSGQCIISCWLDGDNNATGTHCQSTGCTAGGAMGCWEPFPPNSCACPTGQFACEGACPNKGGTGGSGEGEFPGGNTAQPVITYGPAYTPCSNPAGCVIHTAIGDIDATPAGLVQRIFRFVLGIAGGIALILIMLAGYKYMTSRGNEEAVKAANEQLTSAIIGLVFIILSFVILQVIGADILKIPGFNP